MFGVFKLNSYFCNGIKYRLMVHVNEIYAYVCCQKTLLCCKGIITTRNNNRDIGIF